MAGCFCLPPPNYEPPQYVFQEQVHKYQMDNLKTWTNAPETTLAPTKNGGCTPSDDYNKELEKKHGSSDEESETPQSTPVDKIIIDKYFGEDNNNTPIIDDKILQHYLHNKLSDIDEGSINIRDD